MKKNNIPAGQHGYFVKWLRYYLDFCEKFDFDPDAPQSLPYFIDKLKKKRQGAAQQQQAKDAINIYLRMNTPDGNSLNFSSGSRLQARHVAQQGSSYPASTSHSSIKEEARSTIKDSIQTSSNAQWTNSLQALSDAIRLRHYSSRTLESYTNWVHKFRSFSGIKDPNALTTDDVKSFLTFLAVRKNMSASSQNQAFNALLFFCFLHLKFLNTLLDKDFFRLLAAWLKDLTSYAWIVSFMHKRRSVMRTTLDLPDNLVNEAMKATRIKTKTGVIITALEQLIRKAQLSEIKEFKGKIDLDIDLETIRGRKCRY